MAGRERKSVSGRIVIAVVAALVAIGAGAAVEFARLLPGLEQDSVNQRFERRGACRRRGCSSWPSTTRPSTTSASPGRSRARCHAQAIDRLRRDGAAAIVYDVQFTEQTTPREDNALIARGRPRAQRRAGHGRDRRARQQQRARRRRPSRSPRRPRRRQQPAARSGRRAAALPRARPAASRRSRWPPRTASAARRRSAPSTTVARGSTSAVRRARSTPSRSPTS